MAFYQNVLGALLVMSSFVASTQAATLLDTGTPDNLGFPLSLDATDFVASEFHLGSSYTIDSIAGYLTNGNAGDTFTVALFQDSNGHVGTPLQSAQATFTADGWNGISSLNWSAGPGNYWVAFEIGANDNLNSFWLPLSSPNPAIATAFNDGTGYHNFTGMDYGVRVTGVSSVPLPAAAWLFASGIGFIAGVGKRRRV